ncbi:uncharacterized protein LOC124917599 [Impatiens glandulifera]|uniref:uncharacterized protein LOC124917599 n=1 Tax=Impatiens glandulifera TaxID=253017 RepID=UPI001FB123CF|nr:uncharacterized protein LOC124917599 [Impatiens glandulifera]
MGQMICITEESFGMFFQLPKVSIDEFSTTPSHLMITMMKVFSDSPQVDIHGKKNLMKVEFALLSDIVLKSPLQRVFLQVLYEAIEEEQKITKTQEAKKQENETEDSRIEEHIVEVKDSDKKDKNEENAKEQSKKDSGKNESNKGKKVKRIKLKRKRKFSIMRKIKMEMEDEPRVVVRKLKRKIPNISKMK